MVCFRWLSFSNGGFLKVSMVIFGGASENTISKCGKNNYFWYAIHKFFCWIIQHVCIYIYIHFAKNIKGVCTSNMCLFPLPGTRFLWVHHLRAQWEVRLQDRLKVSMVKILSYCTIKISGQCMDGDSQICWCKNPQFRNYNWMICRVYCDYFSR